MTNSVLFAKLFTGGIKSGDSEPVTRQLLLRRSFVLDGEQREEITIETTTLDDKQILLTVKALPNQGQSFFDNFSEEAASEVIQMYGTRTLEEINESQDIDVKVTGVNYD